MDLHPHPPVMLADRLAVAARNTGLLVLSFVLSAIVNIVPQQQFAKVDPARKEVLLSAFLLTGTVAAWAGVLASRRGVEVARRVPVAWHAAAILGLLALVGLAFGSVFVLQSVVVFFVLNALVRFASNFATNHLDRLAVARAGPGLRALNDQAATGFRLVGMLLAPVWFGFFFDATAATLVIAAVATVAMVASAATLVTRPVPAVEPPAARDAALPVHKDELEAVDYAVIVYANLVFAALYVFASNAVYLLQDYMHLDHPAKRAGVLILIVFASAIATVFGAPTIERAVRGPRIRPLVSPLRLLVPSVLITIPVVVYAQQWAPTFGLIAAWGPLIGVGYGLFQLALREYVTRSASERGKASFVTHYNNVANTSALLAFGAMFVLTSVAPRYGLALHWWVLVTVLACTAATVPAVLIANHQAPRAT